MSIGPGFLLMQQVLREGERAHRQWREREFDQARKPVYLDRPKLVPMQVPEPGAISTPGPAAIEATRRLREFEQRKQLALKIWDSHGKDAALALFTEEERNLLPF